MVLRVSEPRRGPLASAVHSFVPKLERHICMDSLHGATTPFSRREDVVETIHGEPVADPYRWLEDESSPEVAAWTQAQNACTRAALDTVPGREEVRDRLEQLLSIGTVTAPEV